MKRIVALALTLAFALALGQSGVEELNRALQQASQLRQQRIEAARAAEERLKRLGVEVQRKRRELETVARDITRLEREKRDLEYSIDGLVTQIAEAEEEIARIESKLGRLKDRMIHLVEKLYRERAGRYLPLLRAQSLSELLMRAGWVQRLGASDVRLVETLTALVRELRAARERLVNLVRELTQKKQAREERIAALEVKRKRYQAVLRELKKKQAAEEVRVVELNKAAEELERQMQALAARLEAERKRLEEERRRREASGQPGPSVSIPRELVGDLLFPIPGGRIVTPFGQADNTWQVIRAGQNYAPVRAAADGQVFATAFYANYGWNVLILHADNLLTRYTNLQEPLVRSGDRVVQGQIIGYLGGSAIIPPNEMWFSVILSQKGRLVSVDPAKYY